MDRAARRTQGKARREAAAAATGDEASGRAAQLRGGLDRGGALPFDHPRIAECVDEGAAALGDQPCGDRIAVLPTKWWLFDA
jgi:hypothetical protein